MTHQKLIYITTMLLETRRNESLGLEEIEEVRIKILKSQVITNNSKIT